MKFHVRSGLFAVVVGGTLFGSACWRCAAAEVRLWTDISGKFKVRAKLVEVDQTKNSVRLKRDDGKIVVVPVAQLSDVDRAFLVTAHPTPTLALDTPTGRAERTEFTKVQHRDVGWPVTVVRSNGFTLNGRLEDVGRSSVVFKVGRTRMTLPGNDVSKIDVDGDTYRYNVEKKWFESEKKKAVWYEYPKQRNIRFANTTGKTVLVKITSFKDEIGADVSHSQSFSVEPGKVKDTDLMTSQIAYEYRTGDSDLQESWSVAGAKLSASRAKAAGLTIVESQLPPPFQIAAVNFRQGSQTVTLPKEYETTFRKDLFGDTYARTYEIGGGTKTVTDAIAYFNLKLANRSPRSGKVTVVIAVAFAGSWFGPSKKEFSQTAVIGANETKGITIKADVSGLFGNEGYRVKDFWLARAWMD